MASGLLAQLQRMRSGNFVFIESCRAWLGPVRNPAPAVTRAPRHSGRDSHLVHAGGGRVCPLYALPSTAATWGRSDSWGFCDSEARSVSARMEALLPFHRE